MSKIVQNNPRVLHFFHNTFGWISNTKWSDIVFIYKQEKSNIVKKLHSILLLSILTTLRDKVQFFMNVFNGKVIAEFRHEKHDTTRLVFPCTRLRIISNTNSPEAGEHLNDPDRNKFEFKTDPRLDFLLKTASAIKLMDPIKRGAWMRGLTD